MIKLFHDDCDGAGRVQVCCEGWRELFIKVGRKKKMLTRLAGGRRNWGSWMTKELWVSGETAENTVNSVKINLPLLLDSETL